MAEAPAYTTVPGKLPDLLKKIRDAGVPKKVNKAWLDSLGYKSSNDGSLVNVLRQIGFVDQANAPTPAWRSYRGAEYKEVLGRAIQLGYVDLYHMYPDAHDRPNGELANFFSSQTNSGKQVVDKMAASFKAVAGEATFESAASTVSTAEVPATPDDSKTSTTTAVARTTSKVAGLNVTINVALTLPATTDERVFDAFFRAMRKHLLSDETT